MYKNSIKILIPALLLLISCTSRIDILTEDAPERLVVYGYVTNTTKQHEIRLTRSSGYFATTKPEGVSDAKIYLLTDEETILLEESSQESGLYLTPDNYTGKEGMTYTLQIALDFDNDGEEESFEAVSTMPYAAPIDSIGFKESTLFDDVIEVQLYGKLPPNDENYLSFHVAINDKIVNDSLSGFFIISDEYIVKDEFYGLSCFYLDQEEEESIVVTGDEVTLYIDILTKEYADFLENAQSESGGSIPIFGGPPANVETNIRSVYNPKQIPISGFFSAFAGNEAKKVYK